MDDLQKFLQWKDPQLPPERAGELLSMFKLSDVAKGVSVLNEKEMKRLTVSF